MAPRHSTSLSQGPSGDMTQRRFITDVVTVLQGASATDESVTLLEIQTPPGGGVPVHSQRYEDETLYVLQGIYTVLVGDHENEVREGGSLFIPRGTKHGYANPGPEPARMLLVLIPGGIHDQFLDEAGDSPDRPAWDVDMAKILAVAPKYGITFVPPDVL